jgi:hypothetical protein
MGNRNAQLIDIELTPFRRQELKGVLWIQKTIENGPIPGFDCSLMNLHPQRNCAY